VRVALFVPCYVDQLRPSVGTASAELLEARGFEVDFPPDQTCCGQPFVSAGARGEAAALARRHLEIFAGADAVVCPSGSCVATVRHRYRGLLGDSPELSALAERTYEVCEFLEAATEGPMPEGSFPHVVGLHASCHALRELRQGTATERIEPPRPDPARSLLARLEGLTFADLTRRDECCGFGGVFAVDEPEVSALAGLDRIEDHLRAGAEVVVSTDVSCLMHLEGLARRQGREVRFLHVVEVLAEALAAGAA
jgi:L-lactate dehydrogenase complex protein LldE